MLTYYCVRAVRTCCIRSFVIITAEREVHLTAMSDEDRSDWLSVVRQAKASLPLSRNDELMTTLTLVDDDFDAVQGETFRYRMFFVA